MQLDINSLSCPNENYRNLCPVSIVLCPAHLTCHLGPFFVVSKNHRRTSDVAALQTGKKEKVMLREVSVTFIFPSLFIGPLTQFGISQFHHFVHNPFETGSVQSCMGKIQNVRTKSSAHSMWKLSILAWGVGLGVQIRIEK